VHRFIVGTGRCGSTLLSKMMGRHPRVASIFEYFNGIDGGRRFQPAPMSGADYRDMICACHPFLHMVLVRDYPVPEVVYPVDAPDARIGRHDEMPWILGTTIPQLTREPDALYDETRAFLARQPELPAPEHARQLFDWWTRRLGREVWIERSGAAIDYMGELDRAFEDARFVHIHRQGEEAALSMREHHAFRLAIMLANDLPAGTGRSADDLRAAVPDDDHIGRLLASRPPPEPFGQWWSGQVANGVSARERIDADRYHEVRFEDLLERPRDVLAEVADFLALPRPEGDWYEDGAALVRSAPPPRLPDLDPDERAALVAACAPGNAALGRG